MAGATPTDEGSLPRGSGRGSRLPLVLVTVVALMIVIVCGMLVYGQFAQADPTAVAQAFMSALEQHDYQAAYTTFSEAGRRHWSAAGQEGPESNFARFAAGLDRRYGNITSYRAGVPSVQGIHAALLVAVFRTGLRDEVDSLGLSRQGSGWAIDTYSPGVSASP